MFESSKRLAIPSKLHSYHTHPQTISADMLLSSVALMVPLRSRSFTPYFPYTVGPTTILNIPLVVHFICLTSRPIKASYRKNKGKRSATHYFTTSSYFLSFSYYNVLLSWVWYLYIHSSSNNILTGKTNYCSLFVRAVLDY